MNINGRLVNNFTLNEMACNGVIVLNPDIVLFAQMMQFLRDVLGKPINVNSWYRTAGYNKIVGGNKNSIHLDGRACDIASTEYDRICVYWKFICAHKECIGGINFYDRFIHLDNYEDKFGYTSFVIRDYRSK